VLLARSGREFTTEITEDTEKKGSRGGEEQGSRGCKRTDAFDMSDVECAELFGLK
jgi:hypothetical protein